MAEPRYATTTLNSTSRDLDDAFYPLDWALLSATALMWGSSFLLIAIGLDDFHPTLITALRLCFGALTLAILPASRRPIPRGEWPAIALLGALWMAGPLILFPIAQQWIDSSVAGMLNGAVPLFAALAGIMVFGTRLTRVQTSGVVTGFVGVILIGSPALQEARVTSIGIGLVIVATMCYGISLNLAAPLQRRHGALPVLLRAQVVAIVLVSPLGIAGMGSSSFGWPSFLAVAALGCFGTALAFVAMTTLVGRVGAARGAIAIYFLPIVAIVLGVVFRNERVHLAALIGTVMVILGAYLTSRRTAPQPVEETTGPISRGA